jgi:hypothetical protein
MSLGPFPIQLIPFTKDGKLQFWNDITKEILEADFSRPNVGVTSGSSVWRNNQLIKLAENEPDWDDADGCPVIKVRPQAENLVSESDPTNDWNTTNANITTGVSDPFGGTLAYTVTGVAASVGVRIQQGINPTVGKHQYGIWAQRNNWDYISIYVTGMQNNGRLFFDFSTGDFEADAGTTVGRVLGPTTDGWYYLEVQQEAVGPDLNGDINVFLVESDKSNILAENALGAAVNLVGRQYVKSDIFVDSLFSPTGAALTRSANQFSFTDLVNKGVTGASGFSVYINTDNFNFIGISNPIAFRDGTSVVFTIASIGNNSFQLRSGGNFGNISGIPSIITFNGTNLRLYQGSSLIANVTISSAEVDNIVVGPDSNCGYDIKKLALAPIVITEAQAIAALNSL